MNRQIAVAVLMLLFISSNILLAKQPSVLVFEATKGQGADNLMTSATTKAIIKYLWETRRVEAAMFNRQSPTVLRAIMEKQLTEDKIASYSSRVERMEVGNVLSYDYVAGSEIEKVDGRIVIKLWLSELNNKKNLSWESRRVARAGGTGDFDLNNAIESAASAVVIDISNKAFEKLPLRLDDEYSQSDSSDITSRLPSSTDDNLSKADQYMSSGSIALAIQYYQQAVNMNPSDYAIRLKLAFAYASKNMNKESEIESENAKSMGASKESIDKLTQDILKLSEKTNSTIETTASDNTTAEDVEQKSNISSDKNINQSQSQLKISEADKLWEQGNPQAAAEIYKDVIKTNPSDWRPYERLAVVLASQSLFNDSRLVLAKLEIIQPELTDDVLFNRYQMLARAFDTRLIYLSNSYDSDYKDFSKKKFSRESYYNSIRALLIQLDSMTKFADSLPAPKELANINLKRYLACGLLAQAATNMQDYLETNKSQSKNNSDTFSAQAKAEIRDIVDSYNTTR